MSIKLIVLLFLMAINNVQAQQPLNAPGKIRDNFGHVDPVRWKQDQVPVASDRASTAWDSPKITPGTAADSGSGSTEDYPYLALYDEQERHIPWEDLVRDYQPCFGFYSCWRVIAEAIYIEWVKERDQVCSILGAMDTEADPDYMRVIIDVQMDKNGYVTANDLAIRLSSGNGELDQSALRALLRAVPFSEISSLNVSEYRSWFSDGYVDLNLDGFRCEEVEAEDAVLITE